MVCFTIKGDYPEGPSQPGLFGEMQPSLARPIIQRMDQAAEDKTVSAVLLRIEDVDMGGGKLNELRAAIARIRKAGKPVYAELTDAETGQYVLAAACEEIYMPPSGTLIVPGVHAEMTFYKGLLDKLGLKFDALQMGKYKGAAEPLTRSGMSPALRENMEAIVNDSYEALVNLIAADRAPEGLRGEDLDGPGVVFGLGRPEGRPDRPRLLRRPVRGLVGQEAEGRSRRHGHQLQEEAHRGRLLRDRRPDEAGRAFRRRKARGHAAAGKRIAVVYAVGEIVEGKGASDIFGNSSLGSATLVEALRKAADDPKVVAVVLRVDSPGGSATASDLIWRETVRMQEAPDRQHGRRGRQRRILHRHGRPHHRRRARHHHRLHRRDRRQAGHGRAVRQDRNEHRSHQPRQEQRRTLVHAPLHARRTKSLDGPAGGNLRPVRQPRRPRDARWTPSGSNNSPRDASTPGEWPRKTA